FIILDFVIQLRWTYSKVEIVNWLGVDKNHPIGIAVMLIVAAILTAIPVWILSYAVKKKAPKTSLHPFRVDKLAWVGYGYAMILGAGMVKGGLQYVFSHQKITASSQVPLEEQVKQ